MSCVGSFQSSTLSLGVSAPDGDVGREFLTRCGTESPRLRIAAGNEACQFSLTLIYESGRVAGLLQLRQNRLPAIDQ